MTAIEACVTGGVDTHGRSHHAALIDMLVSAIVVLLSSFPCNGSDDCEAHGGRSLPGTALQDLHHITGLNYLERKLAEGKTPREARRALKRHLANLVYRRLHRWAEDTLPATSS